MQTQKLHIVTPMIVSPLVNKAMQKNIVFKLEALQPTGSFKIRGIGALCQHYLQTGCRQFVSSSGGNAGIAVAYAAMRLGVTATVFIPSTSHPVYIEQIKALGADLIVAGNVWNEAHEAALKFAEEHEAAYIPPFDHPIIWTGHATMIAECYEGGLKPDAVIVAVGGGGLAAGLLEGMHQCGWNNVPLITVETEGADSLYQSIKAKRLITLEKITSQATSLGAKRVCERIFEWAQQHPIIPAVVSDETAKQGSIAFAKDQRILTELASGAALSLVYHNDPIIRPFQTILVTVCGGVNTTFMPLTD